MVSKDFQRTSDNSDTHVSYDNAAKLNLEE